MFLMATMDDGKQVVSEFSKLGNPQRYAVQAMAGVRPFNVWEITSRVHPVSGDACLIRTRKMLSGRKIASIEVVQPLTTRAEGDMRPESFQPVPMIQRGQYGTWKAPMNETAPAGAEQGVEYPIKRDPTSLLRYVVLKIADGDTPELRHWLEDSGPTDGDEDRDAGGARAFPILHEDDEDDEV